MKIDNVSSVEGFVLLGITNDPNLQIFLFMVFLMFYIFILSGNLSIVLLITNDPSLHKPMYFFLGNLSVLDIFYSTTILPKMLSGLFMDGKMISVCSCKAQLYFYHLLASTEGFLLTAMSYDRYVAICNPLRYHVLMGRTSCIQLASSCWVIGFVYAFIEITITFRLPFCKKHVPHLYCDVKPLLQLACGNTKQSELLSSGIFAFLAISAFSLIIVSYMYIGRHLLKIRCRQERRRAFFTCTSHITTVVLFLGTAMCMHLGPSREESLQKDKVCAILITVLTPALNPLIYTLRNKEIKRSIRRLLGKKQQLPKQFKLFIS